VTIQYAYVPYVFISEFLEGERGDMSTFMEWNVYKNFLSQSDVKQPTMKNHRAYVVNIYGTDLFSFFNSYTKDVINYVLRVFWSR